MFSILKIEHKNCITNPIPINNITDGKLVLLDIELNIYEEIITKEKIII